MLGTQHVHLEQVLSHSFLPKVTPAGFCCRVCDQYCNMQAGSSADSRRKLLQSQEPQLVISMLAAMYMADVPLDFVSTDGETYILYRFHERHLLKYANLSAGKVGTSHCIRKLSSPGCCMA